MILILPPPAIKGILFLMSFLLLFHGNYPTRMLWVQDRCTSMLEIVPKDDEEGEDGEDSEKY